MCATKPIASWPHSPSRTSSSACALAGHPELAAPRALAGEQRGIVRVVGDRDRPGVRHRHRHRAHADHAADPEALDDVAHRTGERLPAVVGLGPAAAGGTAWRRCRAAAGRPAAGRRRPRSGRGMKDIGGPPGPVVVELVHVERRDHAAAAVEVDEVLGGPDRGVAGVEEAVQHHDHGQRGGVVELGHVVDDVHEPGFLGHGTSFLIRDGAAGRRTPYRAGAAPRPPTIFPHQARQAREAGPVRRLRSAA